MRPGTPRDTVLRSRNRATASFLLSAMCDEFASARAPPPTDDAIATLWFHSGTRTMYISYISSKVGTKVGSDPLGCCAGAEEENRNWKVRIQFFFPPDCLCFRTAFKRSRYFDGTRRSNDLAHLSLVIVTNASNRLLMLASVPQRYCHAFWWEVTKDTFREGNNR